MSDGLQAELGRAIARYRIRVRGIVQGVGFRPFVHGLAVKLGLAGRVANTPAGVVIEVQGMTDRLEAFRRSLIERLPPLARIDALSVEEIALLDEREFTIVASFSGGDTSAPVPPDIATCHACLRELFDPADRRHRYPFLNCCHCGPRFTILRALPYDRPNTAMASFTMCQTCQAEYHDPADRRFHAQPIACPDCGPRLWIVPAGQAEQAARRPDDPAHWPTGEEALRQVVEALEAGQIVALKGLGGFHLACDATNERAVALLRSRKGRSDKPFAVMVATAAAARQYASVSDAEERLLAGHERPIVLLRRLDEPTTSTPLASGVAPGNGWIGLMLPYTPLHHLIFNGRPLVMTSGNRSEEPIARDNAEALDRLAALADVFLLHDRPIEVACDDSVMRVSEEGEIPIRRSRGYVPMPIDWPWEGPTILAVGGELKATFCLAGLPYARVSQHLGDWGDLATLGGFERALDHFQNLYRTEPRVVACDAHPGYLSSRWAERFAKARGLPLVPVQHHHAHAAAVLLEHGRYGSEPVIAIVADGTGYGPDGTIWGGEFLRVDDRGYQRLAHLTNIPLPGGDAAISRPYRSALAHLWAAGIPWDDWLPCVDASPASERRLLRQQLDTGLGCVPTSSLGRLFDAVAALIGVRGTVSYEGQAAIELESLAAGREAVPESLGSFERSALADAARPVRLDPRHMLRRIVEQMRAGCSQADLAAWFHAALAGSLAALALDLARRESIGVVGLTGGVFQNLSLTRMVARRLRDEGLEVLLHRRLPPNDGGISPGQAAVARRNSESSQPSPLPSDSAH